MDYFFYGEQAVIGFASLYMMILSVQLRSIKKSFFMTLFFSSLFLFLTVLCFGVYVLLHALYITSYSSVYYSAMRYTIVGKEICSLTFYILMVLFVVDIVKSLCSKAISPHAGSTENTESNRGVLVLTFGIMGVIIFPLLGIVAWVMGRSDLKAMNANNASESSNMSMTKAGVVLGKIATIFIIAMFFLLIIFISNTIQHLQYYF